MSRVVSPPGPSRSSQPLAPASQASALTSSASRGDATWTRRSTKVSLTLLLLLLLLPGCYYAHLGSGQARLLLGRQDIDELLADPSTPPELRAPLERVKAVRRFARVLGLDVGDRYTSYVEWPGDRIVTTVVATAPWEIEPTPFGFPIVGEVPYKGFFDTARAEAEAARLRADGYDVCVVPVSAYSTLGWFDDPVTSPLLSGDPGELVETLLHELVHATVFTPSAARFNEGVATFVGQEATLRFFAAEDTRALPREEQRIRESREVAAVMMRLRDALAELYADPAPGPEARRTLTERARAEIAALPLTRADATRLGAEVDLGDACLALVGTYRDDLPAYRTLLERQAGDLAAFLAAAVAAADAADPVAALLGSSAAGAW
jgi:predicted aminopeptidase